MRHKHATRSGTDYGRSLLPQRHGARALSIVTAHSAQEERLKALSDDVRQRLRLRRLLRDDRVDPQAFERCCRTLLKHADAISRHADGTSLRVGFVNRVAQDGSFIELAWNVDA